MPSLHETDGAATPDSPTSSAFHTPQPSSPLPSSHVHPPNVNPAAASRRITLREIAALREPLYARQDKFAPLPAKYKDIAEWFAAEAYDVTPRCRRCRLGKCLMLPGRAGCAVCTQAKESHLCDNNLNRQIEAMRCETAETPEQPLAPRPAPPRRRPKPKPSAKPVKKGKAREVDANSREETTRVQDQPTRVHDQATRIHDQATRIHDQAMRVHDQATRVLDQPTRVHDQPTRGVREDAQASAAGLESRSRIIGVGAGALNTTPLATPAARSSPPARSAPAVPRLPASPIPAAPRTAPTGLAFLSAVASLVPSAAQVTSSAMATPSAAARTASQTTPTPPAAPAALTDDPAQDISHPVGAFLDDLGDHGGLDLEGYDHQLDLAPFTDDAGTNMADLSSCNPPTRAATATALSSVIAARPLPTVSRAPALPSPLQTASTSRRSSSMAPRGTATPRPTLLAAAPRPTPQPVVPSAPQTQTRSRREIRGGPLPQQVAGPSTERTGNSLQRPASQVADAPTGRPKKRPRPASNAEATRPSTVPSSTQPSTKVRGRRPDPSALPNPVAPAPTTSLSTTGPASGGIQSTTAMTKALLRSQMRAEDAANCAKLTTDAMPRRVFLALNEVFVSSLSGDELRAFMEEKFQEVMSVVTRGLDTVNNHMQVLLDENHRDPEERERRRDARVNAAFEQLDARTREQLEQQVLQVERQQREREGSGAGA